MDTRTPEQRRRIMQSVGTKNTAPELIVRRLLYGMGYRYRLHRKDLPGRPDIAFIGRKKAIFVHGCFWHAHDCPKGRAPKSRLDYWQPSHGFVRSSDSRWTAKRSVLQSLKEKKPSFFVSWLHSSCVVAGSGLSAPSLAFRYFAIPELSGTPIFDLGTGSSSRPSASSQSS